MIGKINVRTALAVMLTLLLTGVLASTLDIPLVRASEDIYIRADGSIDPPTAPIQRNGDAYTLTDNIDGMIMIERDNIVVDGAGHTLQGTRSDVGFYLYNITGVTVKNTNIRDYGVGICFEYSSNNTIVGNNISKGNSPGFVWGGVWLIRASNNRLYHNNFTGYQSNAVRVEIPGYANILDDGYPSGGNYWSDYTGVDVKNGPNQDEPGSDGIGDTPTYGDRYPLMHPYGTPPPPTYALTITATANGTTNPAPGTYLHSQGQSVPVQALPDTEYGLIYWELDGTNVGQANPYSVLMDNNHTLHAVFMPAHTLTITATAGGTTSPPPPSYVCEAGTNVTVTAIPDTYYILDHWELDGVNRTDNPINVTMDKDHTLHAVFGIHDVAVTSILPSRTIVGQGYSTKINVTVANQGDYTETFNVTLYANTTFALQTITLESGASTTITFTWNTTGFAEGNYTISAYAIPVPGEVDTADNLYVDGTVQIVPPVHDLAITDIAFSKQNPHERETIRVNVTVENHGNLAETFDVNVNYTTPFGQSVICTQTITLEPEAKITLSFYWKPTAPGEHEIEAYTGPIPNDTDPSDNTRTSYLYVIRTVGGGSGRQALMK